MQFLFYSQIFLALLLVIPGLPEWILFLQKKAQLSHSYHKSFLIIERLKNVNKEQASCGVVSCGIGATATFLKF